MRFLFALVFFFSVSVWGQEIQIPALNSPVMDTAGLLSQSEREDLSQLAYEIYTHNGPQVTIFIVPDLQGYPIEEFSIRVAEKWQLGTKKAGNGILVTISKNDRKMRIEVGEGIEGDLTDYDTTQYTRKIFPEYFRRGDFHGGLRLFLEDVADRFNIKPENGNSVFRRAAPARQGALGVGVPIVVLIFTVCYFIFQRIPFLRGLICGSGLAGMCWFMMPGISILGMIMFLIIGFLIGLIGIGNTLMGMARSGGSGYGGGGYGGGGGGGWSGGGGGFSGGGSSGSW